MAAIERAAISKSFRAILPSMSADDVTKLRRYCAENFAASAVFVDSPGERASAALAEVVWLATRGRTRAVMSHRRSARAVLAKLHIPTACLKGTAWTGQCTSATKRRVRSRAWRPARPSIVMSPLTPWFKVPARLETQLEHKP